MATIKNQDPHELAQKYFHLTLPTTSDDLKSAYRAAAKKLHTDLSGADTKSVFIAMKEAYDYLVSLNGSSGVLSEGSSCRELTTVDGTPLSELGLGLESTVNGIDCPACLHKGYTVTYGIGYRVCTECDEYGTQPCTFACKSCKGTGRFKQRLGRVVACRTCQGSGTFKHPYSSRPCRVCGGTKTCLTKTEQANYHKCWECHGKGEVPMWNPVLPKGRLT
ncbi:MAG: hypothetical protein HY422_00460 [Candidatus Komeilibacteria bacterium]|nr:hypothetical protein [Candidatus Komeilibacteria bacterium]